MNPKQYITTLETIVQNMIIIEYYDKIYISHYDYPLQSDNGIIQYKQKY